ncbi:MAG: cohesin domain-containing protein [Acidobacteria bacterium]|nr:cohesin domain-containing protein [Acidobacteriota bacterium]
MQRSAALVLALTIVGGCATGRAVRQGEQAAKSGDWDAAVAYYRAALANEPGRIDVRIALQRATAAASAEHVARARELEAQEQWAAAAAEYRLAADLDPANVFAAAKAVAIERRLREEIEAMRPPSRMQTLREQAQQVSQVPVLADPRAPVDLRFTNTAVREVLTSIGLYAGINVSFVEVPSITSQLARPYSIDLQGETLESALHQVLNANQLTFKVVNPRGILVYGSDQNGRTAHDDVYVQVFYLSHVDAQEIQQLLSQLIAQVPGVRPQVVVNKNTNALTVRGTLPVLQVFDQLITANDKPKAEVLIDVEILEVDQQRVKQLGLNLSQYALGFTLSPESRPSGDGSGAQPPFNLNTVSQGVSTADFYTTVPSALIRLLESDSKTKLLARPQLRGQERAALTLKLGDEIPIPTTTFAAQATGGIANQPVTSFSYRPIGINLSITPRVSFDGEIILEITVESSRVGGNVDVAGQSLPSFGSRIATTTMRMRDGESNLLAGLIKEEDREVVRGMPGLNRIPFIRSLFGGTDTTVGASDIIMIITPRILRSQELTPADLAPMYVGTGNNFGATSQPPLITEQSLAGVAAGQAAPPSSATPPAGGATPPPATTAAPPTVQQPPPATPPTGAGRAVGIVPIQGGGDAPPAASGQARIFITPPGAELQMGGQPYNVPLTVTNASQMSTMSLTVTYNPAVLRATVVNEGNLMRGDGATTTFVPRIDADTGRIDLAITRPGDKVGATGNGLLATIVFEAIGPGQSQIALAGVAMSAAGQQIPLQLVPATVTVK